MATGAADARRLAAAREAERKEAGLRAASARLPSAEAAGTARAARSAGAKRAASVQAVQDSVISTANWRSGAARILGGALSAEKDGVLVDQQNKSKFGWPQV
jgi:hypothetical protein